MWGTHIWRQDAVPQNHACSLIHRQMSQIVKSFISRKFNYPPIREDTWPLSVIKTPAYSTNTAGVFIVWCHKDMGVWLIVWRWPMAVPIYLIVGKMGKGVLINEISLTLNYSFHMLLLYQPVFIFISAEEKWKVLSFNIVTPRIIKFMILLLDVLT